MPLHAVCLPNGENCQEYKKREASEPIAPCLPNDETCLNEKRDGLDEESVDLDLGLSADCTAFPESCEAAALGGK